MTTYSVYIKPYGTKVQTVDLGQCNEVEVDALVEALFPDQRVRDILYFNGRTVDLIIKWSRRFGKYVEIQHLLQCRIADLKVIAMTDIANSNATPTETNQGASR